MVEEQVKNKGQKLASGCHHITFDWGHHHFCLSCRYKSKGDDISVTSKEENYFIWPQFTTDQKNKLKSKKVYEKKTAKESISKELEDTLL